MIDQINNTAGSWAQTAYVLLVSPRTQATSGMAAATATAERRHVHLCLTDHRDQTYTLHSVDVEPLFHSEPEPTRNAMEVGVLPLPLPPPAVRTWWCLVIR